ncbi:hypothetical protein BX600DRAFT_434694 [Xylariales sp. PMI_506]|nr:hypothetical protein BX600DRAFT_434694 [Xylariales sp. PMI_506]
MGRINFTLFLAALAASPAFSLTAPIAGYAVEELRWNVEVTPGGPTMALNGTVQQVYAAIKAVHPDFEWPQAQNTTPKARGTFFKTKRDTVDCAIYGRDSNNDPIDGAALDSVDPQITYLRGVSGQPVEGPGPGACGRVACNYSPTRDSAIWWCNK